jgi:hypothetical protein
MGMCGRYERCIWDFGGERYSLKDVGLDGKIIVKWILRKWD